MISVLMSTYNGSKTIDRAIKSILRQTYTNFEFIICNDGSTDDTLKHLIKFSSLDKRVKIINNKHNLGLQKSLDKCLHKSKGSLVARMDDDDISLSNRFVKQVTFLKHHKNISFVGSNIFLSNGMRIYGRKEYPKYPTKKRLFKSDCFAHPSIMIRTAIIKGNGGYSTSPLFLRVEDYELWLRLYSRGYIGANIQLNLLIYNKNKDSVKKIGYIDRIHNSKLLFLYRKKCNVGISGYIYILLPLIKLFVPDKIRVIFNKFLYSTKDMK